MKIKTLIVDDQMGEALSHLLGLCNGYECTVITHGDQVVREVVRNDYDVILMDIELPGLDGLSAIKAIRELSDDIPIIVVTGHKEYRRRAMAAGANDYFVKPFDFEALSGRVYQLVGKRKCQSGEDTILMLKNRRLQKLRERQAREGAGTPPEVLIEIEELEQDVQDTTK